MPGSVLIVDDRRDVLELSRILLSAEGYDTDACAYAQATPERLSQGSPQVLLLDLVPGDDAPWALLKRVRQDESTSDIGVVVTSDSPALVERALRDRDLDIAGGLVMPFDIEELYSAISSAMRRESRRAPVDVPMPLLQRAADVLRRDHQRVLLRWVQRLSALPAFQRRPELTLPSLQGEGQGLLEGVIEALELQAHSHASLAAGAGVRSDLARAHARARRSQGFTAGDLAREMAALRREIARGLRADIIRDEPPLEDVWHLNRRMDLVIYETLFVMLDAIDEGPEP